MRKINFLILTALLLLGVQSAWGATYLPGSWGNYGGSSFGSNTEYEFSYSDGIGTTSIFLAENTEYQFKVYDTNDGWYSIDDYTLNSKGTSATLYHDKGNSKIQSTVAGYYTFTYTPASHNISVTYPTGATTYTIYFDKGSNEWTPTAHIYTSASKNITGAWSGRTATNVYGSVYSVTIQSTEAPYKVIWSNNGSNQTDAFEVVDGAFYNTAGRISAINVNFTADGYATFYHPSCNFLLPDGVTAYTASYSAPKINLTLISGNVVKAGVAVILRGSSCSVQPTSATAADVTSDLFGSDGTVSGGTGIYVLGVAGTNGTIGTAFYKCSTGTIPAYKAYLYVGSGSAPDAIRIEESEETTTDIKSIESSDNAVKFFKNGQLYIMRDGVVYDVIGRIAE